jgi:hypothetical protein
MPKSSGRYFLPQKSSHANLQHAGLNSLKLAFTVVASPRGHDRFASRPEQQRRKVFQIARIVCHS